MNKMVVCFSFVFGCFSSFISYLLGNAHIFGINRILTKIFDYKLKEELVCVCNHLQCGQKADLQICSASNTR